MSMSLNQAQKLAAIFIYYNTIEVKPAAMKFHSYQFDHIIWFIHIKTLFNHPTVCVCGLTGRAKRLHQIQLSILWRRTWVNKAEREREREQLNSSWESCTLTKNSLESCSEMKVCMCIVYFAYVQKCCTKAFSWNHQWNSVLFLQGVIVKNAMWLRDYAYKQTWSLCHSKITFVWFIYLLFCLFV